MKGPTKSFDDTIRGARMCIAGEGCRGRPGVRSCPYYDRVKDGCSGDYRRDLIKWALYWKKEAEDDGSGSL